MSRDLCEALYFYEAKIRFNYLIITYTKHRQLIIRLRVINCLIVQQSQVMQVTVCLIDCSKQQSQMKQATEGLFPVLHLSLTINDKIILSIQCHFGV